MRAAVSEAVVAQFARPRGVLGRLAGAVMARRPSNRLRNCWTVDVLAPGADARILEMGCGPGLALAAAVARAHDGFVLGLDHSPLMVAAARRRLAGAISAGRADVRCAGLEALGQHVGRFSHAYCVNVIQFFPDPAEAVTPMAAVLTTGGVLGVTYQPRRVPGCAGVPVFGAALQMAGRVAVAMDAAGLIDVTCHQLDLPPAAAVCVTGIKERA